MSCECINENRKFPASIACVLVDGYGESFPQAKRYLGGKTSEDNGTTDNPSVAITALCRGEADIALLGYWYYHEIGAGAKDFTIELPIAGVRREWRVMLSDQISNTPPTTPSIREWTFKVEVLDSIAEHTEAYLQGVLCDQDQRRMIWE